jgi:hypothetical protein
VASGAHNLVFRDVRAICEEFRWLFNSYYNSIGVAPPEKHLRAAFSGPSLAEIIAFRTHVDEAMEKLFANHINEEAARRIVLGLNHEQQHQELMLTDIKHAFFSNPLRPAYDTAPLAGARDVSPSDLMWHPFHDGVTEIGYPLDRRTASTFASITKLHATRCTWKALESQIAALHVVSIWSLCLTTPTDARNSCRVWWSSVEIVAIWVYATAILG